MNSGTGQFHNKDCLGKTCLRVSVYDSGLASGAKTTGHSEVGFQPRVGRCALYIGRGKAASLAHSECLGVLAFSPNTPIDSTTMPDEQSGNPPLPTQSQSTSAPAPAPSQPPARKKGTACFRCRSQKTRCDDRQPCSSCSKTGQNCIRPRALDAERFVISYPRRSLPAPPDSDLVRRGIWRRGRGAERGRKASS